MLDEATSAVDAAPEKQLYEALRAELDRSLRGFVSVGHRASLRAAHDALLELAVVAWPLAMARLCLRARWS